MHYLILIDHFWRIANEVFFVLIIFVIVFNFCFITVGAKDTIIVDNTATIEKAESEVYSLLQELDIIHVNEEVAEIVSLREKMSSILDWQMVPIRRLSFHIPFMS